MMRVLVAPQEFKGSLTSLQAALAMEVGLRRARPEWGLDLLPLADGGPGTLDLVLRRVPGARVHHVEVQGPLGTPVAARWLQLPGEVALIELAEASGLLRVEASARRPLDASTFGTGQLILDALRQGCRRLILGAGGSATNDGGAGAACALGLRFLDVDGNELQPTPAQLRRLDRIDAGRRSSLLERATLEVWTDVQNPLLGPTGATWVYGPQKGLGPEEVAVVEATLAHLAQVASAALGVDCAGRAGSGAAGGFAWGLETFCGASIRPAFLPLVDLCGLEPSLEACDLVLTGEGRLDDQTRWGKGPWALAQLARKRSKRTVAFVGRSQLEPQAWKDHFEAVVALTTPFPVTAEVAARGLADAVAGWAAGASGGS
jgi:glycerate kinase